MTSIGMTQTINGKVYVETEDGYEELGEVSDEEITADTVGETVGETMGAFHGDFDVTIKLDLSNNRLKMRKRPMRRGVINRRMKGFMRFGFFGGIK